MNLAQKIKSLREDKDLTQSKLAKISGVGKSSIQLYERGDGNITQKNLEKLATAFNVPVSYFNENKNVPKSNTEMSLSRLKNVPKLSLSPKKMSLSQEKMSISPKNVPQLSPSQENLSLSGSPMVRQSENLSISQNDPDPNPQNGYWIATLTHPASAGISSDIESIEVSDSDKMYLPATLFKTKVQSQNLRVLKVDGYSMIPMLYPDSYVIITLQEAFTGDALYVINYQNILMVKLLQLLPNGNLFIKSTNKDYDSYEIKQDTQLVFKIIGKVLRCII